MLRFVVWSSCLALIACGKGDGAQTSSVTNGKLVLGIVPIKGGESGKDQRYRLLVCKQLPEYSAQVFADTSKCRSALLAQDNKEVDLVGNKLDSAYKDVAHLHAEVASEARVLGASLLYVHGSTTGYALLAGVSATIPALGALMVSDGYKVVGKSFIFAGIALVGGMAYLAIKSYRTNAENKERFGDDSKRNYPVPIGCGGLFCISEYSRADRITHQHWQDIASLDFQNIMFSLEKEDDLRTIVVTLARFYKLKVNEDALQLTVSP